MYFYSHTNIYLCVFVPSLPHPPFLPLLLILCTFIPQPSYLIHSFEYAFVLTYIVFKQAIGNSKITTFVPRKNIGMQDVIMI